MWMCTARRTLGVHTAVCTRLQAVRGSVFNLAKLSPANPGIGSDATPNIIGRKYEFRGSQTGKRKGRKERERLDVPATCYIAIPW